MSQANIPLRKPVVKIFKITEEIGLTKLIFFQYEYQAKDLVW